MIENAERAAGVRDDLTLAIAKDIVYTHHEWWNGTGYRKASRADRFRSPDVSWPWWTCMTPSARGIYRRRCHRTRPSLHILGGKGTHFDPAVVEAFVQVSPCCITCRSHPTSTDVLES